MHIKILQLEMWMTEDWMREDLLGNERYRPVTARFHRPGIYRHGKDCWFELDDGRAFTFPRADFDFSMTLLDVERLSARQIQALRAIVAQKLATRTQRDLLYHCDCAREVRETYRGARKVAMRRFL